MSPTVHVDYLSLLDELLQVLIPGVVPEAEGDGRLADRAGAAGGGRGSLGLPVQLVAPRVSSSWGFLVGDHGPVVRVVVRLEEEERVVFPAIQSRRSPVMVRDCGELVRAVLTPE